MHRTAYSAVALQSYSPRALYCLRAPRTKPGRRLGCVGPEDYSPRALCLSTTPENTTLPRAQHRHSIRRRPPPLRPSTPVVPHWPPPLWTTLRLGRPTARTNAPPHQNLSLTRAAGTRQTEPYGVRGAESWSLARSQHHRHLKGYGYGYGYGRARPAAPLQHCSAVPLWIHTPVSWPRCSQDLTMRPAGLSRPQSHSPRAPQG